MKIRTAILSSTLIVFGFNSLLSYGAEVSKKSTPISKKTTKKWEQEPTSFAGLSLVAPIEQLPNCPYEEVNFSGPPIYFLDYKAWRQKIISDNTLIACVKQPKSWASNEVPQEFVWGLGSGNYEIISSRDIKPFWDSFNLVVVEKKIVELKVSIYSDDYQTAKAILIEKYGQPHKEEKGSLQTKGGAIFPIEKIFWQGDVFSIVFESMNYRGYSDVLKKILEKGNLTIQNVVWGNALNEIDNKRIKNKADSL